MIRVLFRRIAIAVFRHRNNSVPFVAESERSDGIVRRLPARTRTEPPRTPGWPSGGFGTSTTHARTLDSHPMRFGADRNPGTRLFGGATYVPQRGEFVLNCVSSPAPRILAQRSWGNLRVFLRSRISLPVVSKHLRRFDRPGEACVM